MAHRVVSEQRDTCRFGCGATFKRGQFAAHEHTCVRKPVVCDKCHQQVFWGDLMIHKGRKCLKSSVWCSSVNYKMSVLKHEPGAQVASCYKLCKFFSMGCTKQGSEEVIHCHERKPKADVKHWKLVDEYIEMLKKREEATKKLAERLQQASDGCDSWGATLRFIHDALKRYHEMADFAQRALDTLLVVSNVKQGPAREQDWLCELHSGILSIADRLFAIEMELKSYEAEPNDLDVRIRVFKEQAKRLKITGFDRGHLLFKVMAEIEKGAITVISSQLFCTHREGYKLLLCVYLSQNGPGAGALMSVKLVGDNDQIPKRPFTPKKVIFRLRSGPDRPTVEKIVEVLNGLDRPRAGQPPLTIGCSLFKPRQSIEDPSLCDSEHDCIFVEVVVDTGD